MARQGKKLPFQFVKRIVLKEANKVNIVIDQKKEQAIDDILKTLPSQPNPTHLSIWYRKTGKWFLLFKYRAYLEEGKLLFNRVGKEIFYYMNKDEFQRLEKLIKKNKPKQVNPQWIRNNACALRLSITRGCKDMNNNIDWEFVSNKLKVKDFKHRQMNYYRGSKKRVVRKFVEELEKHNPKIFYCKWIEGVNPGLLYQVRSTFDGNWEDLIQMLPDKWRKRWRYYGPIRKIDWYTNLKEFRAVIKKYSKFIYTLYAVEKPAENEIRNNILIDLVGIAKNGNLSARNLLIDAISNTIYIDESLKNYQKFNGLLEYKIERCILQFDLLIGDNFLNYVKTAIRLNSLPFRRIEKFSFDDFKFENGGRNEEFTLTQMQLEDVEDFIYSIKKCQIPLS